MLKKKVKNIQKIFKQKRKKKFIKKFQLSTKYSILFTLKSNKTFRLYIDYKKLNDITIKNRYFLLNINELQNKLNKIKFFIKLNLRENYHFIRKKIEKK